MATSTPDVRTALGEIGFTGWSTAEVGAANAIASRKFTTEWTNTSWQKADPNLHDRKNGLARAVFRV